MHRFSRRQILAPHGFHLRPTRRPRASAMVHVSRLSRRARGWYRPNDLQDALTTPDALPTELPAHVHRNSGMLLSNRFSSLFLRGSMPIAVNCPDMASSRIAR
jgi:hypothetical protein